MSESPVSHNFSFRREDEYEHRPTPKEVLQFIEECLDDYEELGQWELDNLELGTHNYYDGSDLIQRLTVEIEATER